MNYLKSEKFIRTTVLIVCILAFFLSLLGALRHGFMPQGDALRHVAKALSSHESWSDILVVRPEFTIDSHLGWHYLLGLAAEYITDDKEELVIISVAFLFLLFTVPILFAFRRPEAWLFSFTLIFLFAPVSIRLFFGRPLIVSMFFVLVFCATWENLKKEKKPIKSLLTLMFASALSVWLHGTWYLLFLPVIATFLCLEQRVFFLSSLSIISGIILGSIITGSPLLYLYQMIYHAWTALGNHSFAEQLVPEFQPTAGSTPLIIVVGLFVTLRIAKGEWKDDVIYSPVFAMVFLFWLLGFVSGRFFFDWCIPALMFWVATEIEHHLEQKFSKCSPKRIFIALLALSIVVIPISSDLQGRWSQLQFQQTQWPNYNNDEHRAYLPDKGGILYNVCSSGMLLFYNMFYVSPDAPYRFQVGFEPVWMPQEDLEIFRTKVSRITIGTLMMWANRMTYKDRLIVYNTSKPNLEFLKWHEITPNHWIGRLSY